MLSRSAKVLTVILVSYIVCDILLTPAGFETRPVSGITTLGFATLGLIFLGLALIVGSLVLLFRKSRRVSILAILGLLLYFPALIADRTGLFAALPSPDAITGVEIVQAIIAIFGVLFAWRVLQNKAPQKLTL